MSNNGSNIPKQGIIYTYNDLQNISKTQDTFKGDVSCILDIDNNNNCESKLCQILYKIDNGEINLSENNSLYNFKELYDDSDFLNSLNKFINQQLEDKFNNPNISSFDELYKYISLLGMGESHQIIVDLNNSNLEDLKLLLNEYREKIILSDNIEIFKSRISSLSMLLKSLNTLCILDQVNTYKKKTIPQIIGVLDSFVKQLNIDLENKFTNGEKKFFDDESKNYLNYYIGIFEVNFSHFTYVDPSLSFEEKMNIFYNNAISQISGYILVKDSNYGNNPSENKKYEIDCAFLGNFAHSLSLLIFKTKPEEYYKLWNNDKFKMIIHHLGDFFGETTLLEGKTLEEIKSFCNNIFCGLYRGTNIKKIGEGNDDNYENIIKKFIHKSITDLDDTENKQLDGSNLETIYNFILLNDVDNNILIELGKVLLNGEAFNNYSYEFYKLKIIDEIIFNLSKKDIINDDFINDIINYIDKNKTASQLFYPYTSIYFTIASIYSKSSDKCDLTVKYFLKFLKYNSSIDGFLTRHNRDDLYKNIGRNFLNRASQNLDISGDNSIITEKMYTKIGYEVISIEKNKQEDNNNNIILQKINEILDSAIEHDETYNENFLLKELSSLLTHEIFLGLPKISIRKINSKTNNNSQTNGEIFVEIPLNKDYIIEYHYPALYSDIFESIYNDKMHDILPKISNIIKRYHEKEKLLYIDSQTGLPNESRLKVVLKNLKQNKTFLNLKLYELNDIISIYGNEGKETYFNSYVDYLKLLASKYNFTIYKLSNSKLGILCNIDIDIENLILDLNGNDVLIEGNTIGINVKIGLVEDQTYKLLDNSNLCLSNGDKENVVRYSKLETTEEERKESIAGNTKLNEALRENRVITYFQPIIDLIDGSVKKYECLFRVKTDDENVVGSPKEYLPVAEKYKKSKEITMQVIKYAFNFANNNPDISFNINFSGEDFIDEAVLNSLNEGLKNNPNIKAENITLEILESDLGDYDLIVENIKKLKEIGFKIAIDDYGAKHSNIERVDRLIFDRIPDYIKIDGEIVKKLTDPDFRNRVLAISNVESIINKKKIHNFEVVAEYVGNKELYEKCIELGIKYGQGYYIGKPNKDLEICPER